MIRLHLLGGLSLTDHDGGRRDDILAQPKLVALLAYLALASSTGLRRRDELLGFFWPEVDTSRGRRALSQALFVLRNGVGADAIVSRGASEVGVDPEVVWTDAVAFRAAADRQDDEDAMALYRGILLPAFHLADALEFDQWLDRERAQLQERAAQAAWRLADRDAAAGRHVSATTWARRAVDLAPYDERALARLLNRLVAQGDRAGAVRAYEEFAERLRLDLAVEPSAETAAIVRGIRAAGAARSAGPAAQPVPALIAESDVPADAAFAGTSPTPGTSASRRAIAERRHRRRPALLLTIPVVGALGMFGARQLGLVGGRAAADSLMTRERQRVIVADFSGTGRDSTLAATVAELVTLDLSRSPRLEVLTGPALGNTLQLMRRDTLTPLTAPVAREIAEREGVGAVIEGDVRHVGPTYVLSARLVAAKTGALMKGWRAEAADSTRLMDAINTLSEHIREDAGEPLASITSNSYMYRVSTHSLDALRLHARAEAALYAGDHARSAALLEEAIRIDSSFVDAQVLLATVLGMSGAQPSRQVEAIRAAYAYRDRLTPAERYEVIAAYALRVRGDVPTALAAIRNHAELAPREVFWTVYGGLLIASGDLAGAARELARGAALVPTPATFAQLAVARVGLRDLAGARAAVADGMARFPTSGLIDRARVDLALVADGYAAADSLAHDLQQSADARTRLLAQALVDAARGKPAEAIEHLAALAQAQQAGHATGDPAETALLQARLRLAALGDTAGALATAEQALRSPGLASPDARDRPYVAVAHLYAEARRASRAADVLREYERVVPEDFRAGSRDMEGRTRGMIDVLEGRRLAGLARLRSATNVSGITGLAKLADLAWGYERVGAPDSAAAVWRRYLETPYMRRLDADAFALYEARRRVPEAAARLDRGSR